MTATPAPGLTRRPPPAGKRITAVETLPGSKGHRVGAGRVSARMMLAFLLQGRLRSALAMPLRVTPVDQVRSWESQLRAMEREWSEISLRRTRALLADWRGAMSEMRRQHDRLVSDGLWVTGPSDFLDIRLSSNGCG